MYYTFKLKISNKKEGNPQWNSKRYTSECKLHNFITKQQTFINRKEVDI